MGFLTQDGLNNIKKSHYQGTPYTPLDNFINKLVWEPVTNLYPLWLAPNLITLLGTALMAAGGVLTLSYNNLAATEEIPRWVWPLVVFIEIAYETLDSTDGKQARRIQASSPLGQLFDHGLDSMINVNMMWLFFFQGIGLKNSLWSLITLFIIEGNFFIASWEEHYAGFCRTSIGNIGVTEWEYMMRGMFLVTWWKGYAFWEAPLYGSWTNADGVCIFTLCTSLWVFFTINYSVVSTTKSLKPYIDSIPLYMAMGCAAGFVYFGAYERYAMLILLSTCSLLGEISTLMIVTTTAKMSYPLFSQGMGLYLISLILTIMVGPEALGAGFYTVVLVAQVIAEGKFFIDMAREIAEELGISILSVKLKE